jgi:hypothetical protein
MGGSGNKRINILDLERAEETDILRLESFLAADAHELARHRWNADLRGSFFDNPGLEIPFSALPVTLDYVMVHDCVSGLMVRPDNATSLGVDPGEAAFFAPAFPNLTADDSQYIAVKSNGLAIPNATLTFLANAGPGVRWDIVECQPTEVVVEATTRPVFTPPNGPFTPTPVNKVLGGELTFRIRRGTAGGGIPDPDPAWMPLAAVHVRTDATSFSNSDIYDIRPLVAERCPWSMRHPLAVPSGTTRFRSVIYEGEWHAEPAGGVNGMTSGGYFRSAFAGYWSGGIVQKNVPSDNLANFGGTGVTGGSFARLNWEDTRNQVSGGIPGGADRLLTLGAFFPRGYPRWVRYSQAALVANGTNRLRTSGRLPQGPRGILVVTPNQSLRNGIIIPQTLPTHFGETVGCWGQVVGHALWDDIDTAAFPGVGGTYDGKVLFPCNRDGGGGSYIQDPQVAAVVLTGSLPSTTTWRVLGTIAPGSLGVPATARAILVRIHIALVLAGTAGFVSFANLRLSLAAPGGRALLPELGGQWTGLLPVVAGVAGAFWEADLWIPLWPASTYDGGGSAGVGVNILGTNDISFVTAPPIASAEIQGYQL